MSRSAGPSCLERAAPAARVLAACAAADGAPGTGTRLEAALGAVPDWDALKAVAARHGMTGLLYRRVADRCAGAAPREVLAGWRADAVEVARRSLRMQRRLLAVAARLEAADVPFLAIKGPVLAEQVYGDATLRTFSDLDLLVPALRVGEAREALLTAGYTDVRPFDAVSPERLIAAMQEVVLIERASHSVVELHWREGPRFADASLAAEDLLQKADGVELLGRRLPAPGLEDTVLLLAVHAATHDWLRLEDVAALSAALGRLSRAEEAALEARSAALGCRRRLHAALLLAVALGAATPGPALWAAARADREAGRLARTYCARLLADLGAGGARRRSTPRDRAAEIVREARGMETWAAGGRYLCRRLVTPGVNDWAAPADGGDGDARGGWGAAAAALATQARRQRRLWRPKRRRGPRDARREPRP